MCAGHMGFGSINPRAEGVDLRILTENAYTPLLGNENQIMLTVGPSDSASEDASLGWSSMARGDVVEKGAPTASSPGTSAFRLPPGLLGLLWAPAPVLYKIMLYMLYK